MNSSGKLAGFSWRSTTVILILVGIVGCFVAWHIQKEALRDDYLIQNDSRIHVWWMDQHQRCDNAASDPLVRLMHDKSWRNMGFYLIFQGASHWISAFSLTKAFSVILLPITLMLIVLLGEVTGRRSAGLAGALIYCSLALTSWSTGMVIFDGLQRSFRDPILLTGLLALALSSRGLLLVASGLACLFYPLCLPVILGSRCLLTIASQRRIREHTRVKAITIILLLTIVMGLISVSIYTFDKPFYGFKGSVSTNPRFGYFGREPVFGPPGQEFTLMKPFLVSKSTGILGHSASEAKTLIMLMGMCLVLYSMARSKQIPQYLISFLGAGLGCYLMAWIVAFTTGRFLLYFPSRFNVSLLCFIVWSGILISQQRKSVTGRMLQVVAVLLVMMPRVVSVEHHPGYVKPTEWEMQLFQRLNELPGREIIAGPPDLLNNIPCFTCSSIYLSFEMDTEMRGDNYRERFETFFTAYFSDRAEVLNEFAESQGITHILVDERMFEDAYLTDVKFGIQRVYLEPFSSQVRTQLINQTASPVLKSIPSHRIQFRYGPFVLVNIQPSSP